MKLIAGISLAITALTTAAQAVTVIVTDSQTNGTDSLPHTYVPSASDLINGLNPTAQAGDFTKDGTGGVSVLNDGSFPSPITRGAAGPFQTTAFAGCGSDAGTTVTYTLGTASDIGSIDVYGGWGDGGRDQQKYTISYSTAGDPGTFLSLTSVDFTFPDPNNHPLVSRVSFTDTTGTLAANVAAIRFDFGHVEHEWAGYTEIDVFAPAAVPEPGTMALLGLATIGMTALRRRR